MQNPSLRLSASQRTPDLSGLRNPDPSIAGSQYHLDRRMDGAHWIPVYMEVLDEGPSFLGAQNVVDPRFAELFAHVKGGPARNSMPTSGLAPKILPFPPEGRDGEMESRRWLHSGRP